MVASSRSRPKAPRIRVNGVFLDEVRTRLEPRHHGSNSVSLLSRPAQHYRLITDGDSVILRIPALTALQLYYDGVLPTNREHAIELKVGRKKIGQFVIESLRRVEGYEFGEPVLIRLARVNEDGKSKK